MTGPSNIARVASTKNTLSEDSDTETALDMDENFINSQSYSEPFPHGSQGFSRSFYREPSIGNDTEAEEASLPSDSVQSSPIDRQNRLRRQRSPSPITTNNQLHKRIKHAHNAQEKLTTMAPNPIHLTSILRLPAPIRTLIYTLAASPTQPRVLELHAYNTITHTPKLQYHPPLPALFSLCRESRHTAIATAGGEILHFTGDSARFNDGAVRGAPFYFNFSTDTVALGARFAAAGSTTETQRLAALTAMLRPHSLARIERLLLAYSGRDAYGGFGALLGSFAGLQTLSVGVRDRVWGWAGARGVREGGRAVGGVAQRIKSVVEEFEADETEDEMEGEDEVEMRLAVKAARRFVEVRVRLEGKELVLSPLG